MQWGKLARTLSQPDSMKCGICMSIQSLRHRAFLLLMGYEDGTLALWDISQQSTPLTRCKPHGEPIMAMAVSNHGILSILYLSAVHISCELQ